MLSLLICFRCPFFPLLSAGFFTLIFLELGCHVVAFEPLGPNLHRALASARANGLADRLTVYQNAVGAVEAPLFMELNKANPGASEARRYRITDTAECVMVVPLDGLFARAARPLSPTTGRPFQPWEVSFIKVDVEGFDASAFDAMQGSLAAGRGIPVTTMECVAACDGVWE